MNLSESQRTFLERHQAAAMITIGRDSTPRVARVGVALVDGKLRVGRTHFKQFGPCEETMVKNVVPVARRGHFEYPPRDVA